MLRIIRVGEEPKDKVAFLKLINLANGFSSPPPEPATLLELVSSGQLLGVSSPPLRRALIRYHELIVTHQRRADLILVRVSEPHTGFHSAFYMNPDFKNWEQAFDKYDWDGFLETREQLQVLVIGTEGLSRQMEELIVRAQTVLTEIEEAQQ